MALIPMTLRLETPDGYLAEEYRIRDEIIEVRHFGSADCGWDRLTAEQIAEHVQENTVVAKWLEHRLGWQRLLRSCVRDLNIFHMQPAEKSHRAA